MSPPSRPIGLTVIDPEQLQLMHLLGNPLADIVLYKPVPIPPQLVCLEYPVPK